MKLEKINRKNKYDMTMLYEFILLVAVIVIVSLLVFQVNSDARSGMTASQSLIGTNVNCGLNSTGGTDGEIGYSNCSIAYQASLDSDLAVAKIPKSLKLLATAVVFGAVLWVILRVIPIGNRATTGTFQ